MSAADEWRFADRLRRELDAMKLPPVLRQQISFRHAQPSTSPTTCQYPPRPGSCDPPGHGSARIWGDFTLAQWVEHAPGVLGPTTLAAAAALDHIAARLRHAGEGTRVLWALDLLHDEWRCSGFPRPAFNPSDVVCFGPYLSAAVIADVDALFTSHPLAEDGWGRIEVVFDHAVAEGPNAQGMWNGVRCYETTWVADINYPACEVG